MKQMEKKTAMTLSEEFFPTDSECGENVTLKVCPQKENLISQPYPEKRNGRYLCNLTCGLGDGRNFLWRLNKDVAPEDRQGDCQFTYKHFIKREESAMSYGDWKYLNLERSWVGLLISSAAIQLFTVLALICGLWPGDCNPIKKVTLYVIAAVFSLLADKKDPRTDGLMSPPTSKIFLSRNPSITIRPSLKSDLPIWRKSLSTLTMCGITGCICFIALRDIDKTSNNIYPDKVSHNYSWSFMLAWIGTGLCIIEGFFFICLLRMDYDDVGESNKHKIYSPM
ncbi:hypothetical protein CHS0354_005672 [Potamilus streckersoni]|uniref:Uncharacterized protein n=1 Tax=Potamilus streckersoni TaxID=2493646 RepID=A0AAE0S0A5_9BIVA|nr:hypothetical protein CHS0354_005672 [Potamilus streckersoni]